MLSSCLGFRSYYLFMYQTVYNIFAFCFPILHTFLWHLPFAYYLANIVRTLHFTDTHLNIIKHKVKQEVKHNNYEA